jgi:hypothetical protein
MYFFQKGEQAKNSENSRYHSGKYEVAVFCVVAPDSLVDV